MKLATLIAGVAVLLANASTLADETSSKQNSNLCGNYLNARLSDTDAKLYQSWVKGYIIGHNQQVAASKRVAQPDDVAFHTYVSKFCEANPTKEVTAAVVCLSATSVNPKLKECNIQQL